MLAALGPALLLLANTGCRTCNCIDGDISYYFTGYTATELQVVVIKTYPAGSNFSIFTDSTTYLDETDFRLERRGDSIYFNPSSTGLKLRKGNDYLIKLPAANRTYRVDAIRMLQVRDDCNGKSICINPLQSLRINGNLLEGPFPGITGFVLPK